MEDHSIPSVWSLLKRHFISWFGLQLLLGIVTHMTLFRYVSEEISVLILSELPILYALHSSLTYEAFVQMLQHHFIQSSYHAYQIGFVARWWTQIISVILALVYTLRLVQVRVYWSAVICVVLYLLQRRSWWYPQLTIIYRRAGAEASALIRSEIEAQEQIIMILRHGIMLVTLLSPANITLALGLILVSQVIQSLAQTAIYQYKIKVLSTELKLANIDEYDAPGFITGFAIMRKMFPYIVSAIKTTLFNQGEYIAVLYLAPTIQIAHYYTLLKNIRSALQSTLAQPIASCMGTVFSHEPHRTLLSFLTGTYGVGWLLINIASWLASPIAVWPILYYYGGQEALDKPELVHMVALLLLLFPIDIADAVVTVYWQVRQTKPIALWLDVIMSVLYLLFSIEIMRVWQLHGLVYAHSIPIIWSALMRGAL